jgi:amino acid adenylation domain-containing protein
LFIGQIFFYWVLVLEGVHYIRAVLDFFSTVIDPFIVCVETHAAKSACVVEGVSYNYDTFGKRVLALAEEMERLEGDAVGLYTENHVDTYAAIWAIWITGKHYVPIQTNAPTERNAHILAQAGVLHCLQSADMAAWQTPNREDVASALRGLAKRWVRNEQLAYVLFTSGSTGTPKGVVISKANLAAFVRSFHELGYGITPHDKVLQMFELTFDLSILSYLMAFLYGATLYTVPSHIHKMNAVAMLLEEEAMSVAVFVPSLVQYLQPYFDELHFPSLRLAIFCGEPLQEQLLAAWATCCPNAQLDNIYGPTENTVVCTRYTYRRGAENSSRHGVISLGTVMVGNTLLLFDEAGNEVPNGMQGEIVMAGPQLTRGYLGDAVLNERLFFLRQEGDAWVRYYRSGDLAVQDADGAFNFIARSDFQVKVQGHRVELGEIEFHARSVIGGVKNILAMAIKNRQHQFEVVLFVEGSAMDTTPVMQVLRSRLPAYMLPTQWCFVQAFPINSNGKTDRKQLQGLVQFN